MDEGDLEDPPVGPFRVVKRDAHPASAGHQAEDLARTHGARVAEQGCAHLLECLNSKVQHPSGFRVYLVKEPDPESWLSMPEAVLPA